MTTQVSVQEIISNTQVSKSDRLVAILTHGHSRKETTDRHERAIRSMLKGWAGYADAAKARFESPIGEDYVLGPPWEAMGKTIIALLDGITGGLDCGDVDSFIRQCLTEEGFDGDNA